jgi:chemotaxis protein CheD
MSETIVIGIGEYIVVNDGTKISTIGLGSCIGTVVYDEFKKISGMSHIMLPIMGQKQDKIGKYADAAIPAMIEEIIKKGAMKNKLKAKIAGGASLFTFSEDHLQIGQRNIDAVKKVLTEQNVRLVAEDVGGDKGRTITFNPDNSELLIRMVRGEEERKEKVI